jgi:hypothetical protein
VGNTIQNFTIDPGEYMNSEYAVHPLIKAVVLFLALNLAIASFCTQACSTPQPVASHCPQHPQSGNKNCCDHSSNDATMTVKVDCAPGLRSLSVLVMLHPQMHSSNLRIPTTIELRRFHPPDSILRHDAFALSTVLRV